MPEFITQEDFYWAVKTAEKKKKIDCGAAEFLSINEGLCVQILHIGAFEDEPISVAKMNEFIAQNGFKSDFSDVRAHHEIYLTDPRKTDPQKYKTIIRQPICPL